MNDHRVTSYRLKALPGARFIRRHVSVVPTDGELYFIDRGTEDVAVGYSGAFYRGGSWFDLKSRPIDPPTYWTEALTDG